MSIFDDYIDYPPPRDDFEEDAKIALKKFFTNNSENVYYSRQIEVIFEDDFFHWVTHRALNGLIAEGFIKTCEEKLKFGGNIKIFWHKSNRYVRRKIKDLLTIVEEYSSDEFGAGLGQIGELLAAQGFARIGFNIIGTNTNEYLDKKWVKTSHDLDLIIERDKLVYGVEVKNTLTYIDKNEFRTKIELCKFLEIIPVFVVRMLPKNWMKELMDEGGIFLILKFQLYPYAYKHLARKVREQLGLPVDSPKALMDGTMQRFLKLLNKNCEFVFNSHN